MRTGALACLLCFVLACGAESVAGQIALVDQVVTFTKFPKDWGRVGVEKLPAPAGTPTDWTATPDYFRGKAHVRLDVLSKPDDTPLEFSVGFGFTSGGSLSSGIKNVRATGVFEDAIAIRNLKSQFINTRDQVKAKFAGGVSQIHLAFKGDKAAASEQVVFPVTARVRVDIVSRNARYDPHWSVWGLRREELKELRKVARYVQLGRLGYALREARKELDSAESAGAAEARRAVEALEGYADAMKGALDTVKLQSPDYAVKRLMDLAREFSGSEKGKDLSDEARRWTSDPEVKEARAALAILASIERTADALRKKLKGKKCTDPKMGALYRRDIVEIENYTQLLEKKFPGSVAYRRALSIKLSLGIIRELVINPTPPARTAAPRVRKAEQEEKPPPEPPPKGNLVSNGGFEEVSEETGFAAGWQAGQMRELRTKYSVRLDRMTKRSGRSSVVCRSFDEEGTPGVLTTLSLTPYKYELSFWACADLGETATVTARLAGHDLQASTVTEEWTRFKQTVTLEKKHPNARLRIWITTPRVRVWLDDVELRGVQ
jgi:hypothetical protein